MFFLFSLSLFPLVSSSSSSFLLQVFIIIIIYYSVSFSCCFLSPLICGVVVEIGASVSKQLMKQQLAAYKSTINTTYWTVVPNIFHNIFLIYRPLLNNNNGSLLPVRRFSAFDRFLHLTQIVPANFNHGNRFWWGLNVGEGLFLFHVSFCFSWKILLSAVHWAMDHWDPVTQKRDPAFIRSHLFPRANRKLVFISYDAAMLSALDKLPQVNRLSVAWSINHSWSYHYRRILQRVIAPISMINPRGGRDAARNKTKKETKQK